MLRLRVPANFETSQHIIGKSTSWHIRKLSLRRFCTYLILRWSIDAPILIFLIEPFFSSVQNTYNTCSWIGIVYQKTVNNLNIITLSFFYNSMQIQNENTLCYRLWKYCMELSITRQSTTRWGGLVTWPESDMHPNPTGFVTGRKLTPGTPTAIHFLLRKNSDLVKINNR